MNKNGVVDFSTFRSSCQFCGLSQICLSADQSGNEIKDLNQIVHRNRKIEHGDYLFREDDPFNHVYAIHTGSIKTCSITENGNEYVTGFHLPGELMGLNAISTGIHTESAIALETSSVCEIPFERLESLAKSNPDIQHLLLMAMSEEIQNDHNQLAMISRMSAEVRLASFLLSLSCHLQQRGYSATEFNLSLSRSDIASLLGLAVETISRLISRFQREGLITVNRKYFALHDLESLKKMAPKCSSLPYPGYSLSNKAS